MMGSHHAVRGAAAWIALTATAPHLPAFHMAPASPGVTALGALLCAGAALGPDADYPQATLAHSAGVLSEAVAGTVGHLAGGHRHGTHAPLVAVLVVALVWAAGQFGWVGTVGFATSWWVCAAVVCGLMCFAVKVLRLVRSWLVAWLAGAAVSAGVVFLWPAFLPTLPAVVAVGWVVHLCGDLLTTGGLPLFWPFQVGGPAGAPDWLWGQNGYVALPVLGNAGSFREWLLCVPISLYALAGMALSLYTLVL